MENKVYYQARDQAMNQVYNQIFSKIDLSIDHLEYSMVINRVSVDAIDRIKHEVYKKLLK